MITYKELKKYYKYQLTRQYQLDIDLGIDSLTDEYFAYDSENLRLTIKRGYKWDGPSGPTIDTDTFMRGSLVHDLLYQFIYEGILTMKDRQMADYTLYNICREDGMNWIRAGYVHSLVRLFGRGSATRARYDG